LHTKFHLDLPQYIHVTDRTDRQTDRQTDRTEMSTDSGPIAQGEPFYKRFTQKDC